jgi:hypothetical protein
VVAFGAEQTEIKVKRRMIEARFERMFEFISGLGIFAFALRVDGLPKV